MPTEAAFNFALFGEDRTHWQTVSTWADTILGDTVEFLRDQPDLAFFRSWVVGPEARLASREWIADSDVNTHKWPRIRPHGDMGRTAFLCDEFACQKRLQYASLLDERPVVVALCRDVDDEPDRRAAARRAAAAKPWPFAVVIAIAQPEMEAWRIALWAPATEPEHAHLAQVRQSLGLDPTVRAAELSSSPRSPRDAKKVLAALRVDDRWASATVERLKATDELLGVREFVTTAVHAFEQLAAQPG